MKKIILFSGILFLLLALFISIYFLKHSTYDLRSKTEVYLQFPIPTQLSSYQNIKGVAHYFVPNYWVPLAEQTALPANIQKIKALGFNTVYLLVPWPYYQSEAFPTPVYNDSAFLKLRDLLALLKANNLRVLLLLNSGVSNPSDIVGIDNESWLTNQSQYKAFELYVQEFLTRIYDYKDIVYIMFYTEGTGSFINGFIPNDQNSSLKLASLLRSTLGSLPDRIPKNLRQEFRFGYHDGVYLIANLNLQIDPKLSPLNDPPSYDFFSIANYDTFSGKSPVEIVNRLDQQVSRFKQIYPYMPLIVGEMGATSCSTYMSSEDIQAQTDTALINYALSHRLGFSLWGWQSIVPDQSCNGNNAEAGLGIYNADGSPKKVVNTIKTLLHKIQEKPVLDKADVNTDFNPWAVGITGKNLFSSLKAQIYDESTRWGEDISVTLSTDGTWLSFQLPGNVPPSKCNEGKSCNISVILKDSLTKLSSNQFIFTLPSSNPKIAPTILNADINTDYQPWAVWVKGKDLDQNLIVRLYDGENQWGGDIPITLSSDKSWLSFSLPANSPPSNCNPDYPCQVSLVLIDSVNNLSSNTFSLTLPVPPNR